MKKLIAVCVMCVAGGLFAQTKIATVDLEMVVFCHPKAESTNKHLRDLDDQYMSQLEEKGAKIEKLKETQRAAVEKFNNPAVSEKEKAASRETALELEAKLSKEISEFTELRARLNKNFTETKANLFDVILNDVEDKLSKYAKDKKIDLVLNKSDTIPVVLFASPAIDITEDVIKATGGDVKRGLERAKEMEKK